MVLWPPNKTSESGSFLRYSDPSTIHSCTSCLKLSSQHRHTLSHHISSELEFTYYSFGDVQFQWSEDIYPLRTPVCSLLPGDWWSFKWGTNCLIRGCSLCFNSTTPFQLFYKYGVVSFFRLSTTNFTLETRMISLVRREVSSLLFTSFGVRSRSTGGDKRKSSRVLKPQVQRC